MTRIGIIGLGEAGLAITAGLHEENGLTVTGYDVRADDPALRQRATRAGVQVVASIAELAAQSSVLICLTSARVARSCAEEIAPQLTGAHCYTDWNSASPHLMLQVAEVVSATGAAFADGAVMAAVPPARHKVPVLLSGAGARPVFEALDGLGMDLEVVGDEPGQASAVKMFRSLLVKGLEALLLECAVGAHEYGATDRVLSSMTGGLPTEDWPRLAGYLLQRTLAHGQRRAEELRQVAGTLADVGMDPLLAEAGARRLQWFADLDLGPNVARLPYDQVLAAVAEARR